MVYNTSFDNASVNIIHNILTTVEPLTTRNYSNHTNVTNHTNDTNHSIPIVIIVMIVIISLIICSIIEAFNKLISPNSEPCCNQLIKLPFLIIASIPDLIASIVICPFGITVNERYVAWRSKFKDYCYIICLNCVDRLFNIQREETLPQNIFEAYIDEINEFFSDEYETIEYPNEEIEVCSICMDKLDVSYDDKNEKSVLLTCGHCFHEQCLKSWYKSSIQKDCPICREDLKIKNYYVFKEI
jgi:hypothetical protein